MNTRTILLFPQLENDGPINTLRDRFDPLAKKVRPHITLVFPFESGLSTRDISAILANRLKQGVSFPVTLQGLSVSGEWLFLNVTTGREQLAAIHRQLYAAEFSAYRPSWLEEYTPHLTVGRFPTPKLALEAFRQEAGFQEAFSFTAHTISVEIIGPQDESILETEYRLQ